MINVDIEKCTGCGQCVKDCFVKDLELTDGKVNAKNVACFKCGHCIAVCPYAAITMDDYKMEDVKEYNKAEFSIDADHLLNFIKFRRTIRQFKDKEVAPEMLAKIIEAGRFTQTGSNMQDVSFIVVKDNLETLKTLTFESLKAIGENILANLTPQTMMYQRYAQMWTTMQEEYTKNPKENDKLFFNAPAVIIVTANSDINAGLASSNMELMTNALGLGTFFSGFFVRAAHNSQKITELLGVKEGKHIVSCLVIGHPNVKYSRTVPRKAADITWK